MIRRIVGSLLALLVIAGCASNPPPPDWQMNAHGAIERAVEAYLSGQTRVEVAEFDRARAEISRTGRTDLLARAELVRCAARVASLVFEPCEAYRAMVSDAAAPERAYAAYLEGMAQAADLPLLPPQHRNLAASGATTSSLKDVEDPLARLVAAAVFLRRGVADPLVISTAIDTASAQGWRRPLLAWLGVQAARAEQAGDGDALAQIQRRIALVSGASTRPRASP